MEKKSNSCDMEIWFNGSIDNFIEMVDLFALKRAKRLEPYYWRSAGGGSNFVQLVELFTNKSTFVSIKAQSLPKNQALLNLHYLESSWQNLHPYWDDLLEEMIRLGWVLPDNERIRISSGRPRDKANEWAYNEVWDKQRNPKEVYPEWLSKKDTSDVLADPKDSFNKAIRKRGKK